jgi:5-methylcytosine-specific restriction endonuclease McrA
MLALHQNPEINRAGKRANADRPLTTKPFMEVAMAEAIIRKQYARRKCDPFEVDRIWAERGGVKCCTKCGHAKQRDQFKPRPKERDGAASECKDCRNAHDRAKRAPFVSYSAPRKKVKPSDYGETTWRPIEVANAHDAWQWWLDNAPDWWKSARKTTIKARSIDRDRASWRAAKHIKRAKAYGVEFENIGAAELDSIRKAGTCHWCGCATTQYDGQEWRPTDATIEHIIPLTEGGGHTRDNLTCACAACNFGRGDSNWGRVIAA